MNKHRGLNNIVTDAIECAKKAKQNSKSLSGDNHYGNKFHGLKIEAKNFFQNNDFAGNNASMGELIDEVFRIKSTNKERLAAYREINYILKTTIGQPSKQNYLDGKNFIPNNLLGENQRTYLIRLVDEINNCYQSECYTSCMVMIRRLMEVCIIDVFEENNIQSAIKNSSDNYFMLEELVTKLINQKTVKISRSSKESLPKLRTFGNLSAHGKYFYARKDDLDKIHTDFRALVEELLRLAKLI